MLWINSARENLADYPKTRGFPQPVRGPGVGATVGAVIGARAGIGKCVMDVGVGSGSTVVAAARRNGVGSGTGFGDLKPNVATPTAAPTATQTATPRFGRVVPDDIDAETAEAACAAGELCSPDDPHIHHGEMKRAHVEVRPGTPTIAPIVAPIVAPGIARLRLSLRRFRAKMRWRLVYFTNGPPVRLV